MKKKFFISVIVFFVIFCIFIAIEIIVNKTHIPDIDQLKIKILKEEFEANYKNFSHDSIENIQKKHKKTLLSDVLFFYPNSYCTEDILVLAYWKNIYKDKEFIVILYKNGTIATRLIDN